jgi:hypothetical protein
MLSVLRQRRIAIVGTLAIGGALALSSFSVVFAGRIEPSARPDRKFKCNTVYACLYATNSDPSGGYGIYATDNAGVAIYATSTSGAGVSAFSTSDLGVFGNSENDRGVYGYSVNGTGGAFENFNGNYAALYAQADYPGAYPLEAYNNDTEGYFEVDGYGDGYFSGTVYAAGFVDPLRARGGRRLGAYGAESTRATIEDIGTARLVQGQDAVRFDPTFASAIDPRQGYQVFVTPNGDTHGLYVAAKDDGGFVVRENQRGRSTVTFDYRVVAHPVGANPARLPGVSLKRPARPPAMSHPSN